MQDENDDYVPNPDDYPVFPPPPPSVILQDSAAYWTVLSAKRFGCPMGVYEDSSLYALYRLYEVLVLDRVIDYRNALERFWRQKTWAVEDIPDPKDDDPERYAFVAATVHLIARSFNARVKLGLDRQMPSIILPEEAEELRNRPDHLRTYEKVPAWVTVVPPLEETLRIPTHEGQLLVDEEDERADPDFLAKNILLWTPHIYFT